VYTKYITDWHLFGIPLPRRTEVYSRSTTTTDGVSGELLGHLFVRWASPGCAAGKATQTSQPSTRCRRPYFVTCWATSAGSRSEAERRLWLLSTMTALDWPVIHRAWAPAELVPLSPLTSPPPPDSPTALRHQHTDSIISLIVPHFAAPRDESSHPLRNKPRKRRLLSRDMLTRPEYGRDENENDTNELWEREQGRD